MGSLIFRFMFLKKKVGLSSSISIVIVFWIWFKVGAFIVLREMGLFLEFWTCYFQIYSLFGFPEKCSGKGGKILNLVIQLIYGAPAKPSRESPMTHTFNFLYFPHFLWNQTCCLWWWSWFLILFFLKGIISLVFTVSISPISFPTESLFFFSFFSWKIYFLLKISYL